jgi:UDP-3-O-[3-hydroxymyristoyl] glucosamine N-acyltransferase
MEMTLAQIADRIGGVLCGDGALVIRGAAPFETAGPQELTLAGGAAYLKALERSRAAAFIVPEGVAAPGRNLIQARWPMVLFARALALFHPPPRPVPGIHPSAQLGRGLSAGAALAIGPLVVVGERVRLGDRVVLHPHVVVGDDVVLGDDVELWPHVTVLQGCQIGDRVVIQAGSVIGSDGFGYAHDGERYTKIRHLGRVVIEDDVEIGAGNTIDRATFGVTRIGRGVKTDNLVHIAHNVSVGEHSVIVAQVGIAGSTQVGRHVTLAGQAGLSGHITIGDGAVVGPQAGVAQSVAPGAVVSGSPEMPHRQWLRVQRSLPRLPELRRQVAELERRLAALEGRRSEADPDCGT